MKLIEKKRNFQSSVLTFISGGLFISFTENKMNLDPMIYVKVRPCHNTKIGGIK